MATKATKDQEGSPGAESSDWMTGQRELQAGEISVLYDIRGRVSKERRG